ncbi:hypothetical protein HX089_05275 [Myroides odoratimimus]|uniref:hypothetical protein n=1 Tax=Myroides odoratimimus TaxID=76832 RepID=UPI0025756A31|nr:hypothetical protein [Myroides odoratimimus]MDM1505375.1 hypothetical protein [Myroides odoratimimus]MDM1515802.1 hypothetical protein [Myroides odoratimimus]
MNKIYLLIMFLFGTSIYAQVASPSRGSFYWNEKEFSKDIALFRAKFFLFNDVLGKSEKINTFEVIPLASASSGELTTLLYRSEEKAREGIVLGFYGSYWNDSGVVFKGYAYKDLDKDDALEFLDKISSALNDYSKFLKSNTDNNNIYFSYKDIDVLISYSGGTRIIRLFWNGFDSTWDGTAFDRSKRRFEKRIK